jgi:hypothetical protein
VRAVPVGFASITNIAEPMPTPEAPVATVIQLTVLTAPHEHCVPLMMVTVRLPAVDDTEKLVGETL